MTAITTTRRPSAATMRAALVKAGTHTANAAKRLNVKDLLSAYEQIPAVTPKKAPAKAPKPAPKAKAPKTPAKSTATNCLCGCGAPTITAKARFLSGHDARFAGLYGRGEIALTPAQMEMLDSSPALRAKVDRVIATTARKAAAKQAKADAKAAAKAAFEAAMAKVTAS